MSEEIGLMRSLKPQDLGERLERERARRFVGWKEELELIRTRLAAALSGPDMPNLFSALWVHGPGGSANPASSRRTLVQPAKPASP